MNAQEFYSLRDQRTILIAGTDQADRWRELPILVQIGKEECESESGQVFALTLSNLFARVHRRVEFEFGNPEASVSIPKLPWICEDRIGGAVLDSLRKIDPFGEFIVRRTDSFSAGIKITFLNSIGTSDEWYFSYAGYIGNASRVPGHQAMETPSFKVGAAVSAILASSVAFKTALGIPSISRSVSAWNLREWDEADKGPQELPKIDVGRVLMVGAGAVGSCLAYWLFNFGVVGEWLVIDRDKIMLHNTNRSLPFIPDHTAEYTGTELMKADVVAGILPNAQFDFNWFHESPHSSSIKFDVELCLANEKGVRSQISQRRAPVSFQATTGQTWVSQLHRHLGTRDGCIACRMESLEERPQLACSTAEVRTDSTSRSDAALPFLSAMSGLMLYSALQRLQIEDSGILGRFNLWNLDFRSDHLMCQRPGVSNCSVNCSNSSLPNEMIRQIYSENKWIQIC